MPIYRDGVRQENIYIDGVAQGNVYRDGVRVFSSVVVAGPTPFETGDGRVLFASLRTNGTGNFVYDAGTSLGFGSDSNVLDGSRRADGYEFILRRVRLNDRFHFTGVAGGVVDLLAGIGATHSVYFRPSEIDENATPIQDGDAAWLEFPFVDKVDDGGGFVRWDTTSEESTYLNRYGSYSGLEITASVFDIAFNTSGFALPS